MAPTPSDPEFAFGDQEVARGVHRIFVVAIAAEVMGTRKFAGRNPNYRPGQPCYFVNVTDFAAELRFDQHMHGRHAPIPSFPGPRGKELMRR